MSMEMLSPREVNLDELGEAPLLGRESTDDSSAQARLKAEEAIDSTPGNSLLEQSPSETIRGEDGRPGSRNVSDHNAGRKRKPAKKHSSLLKLIERSPSLKNLMGGRKTIEPSRSILKKGPKSRNRGSPGSGFEDCESVSSVKTVQFIIPDKKRGQGGDSVYSSLFSFQIPLILPRSRSDNMFRLALLIAWTYESFAIPFRLAISEPGLNAQLGLDIASDCLWLSAFMASMVTAVVLQTGQLLSNIPEIWPYRLMRSVPDVICVPPMYIAAFLGAPLWVWWLCGALRFTRTLRLVQYFNEAETRLDVEQGRIQVLKFFLVLFLSIHWIGCAFFFIARVYDFGEHTWVLRVSEHVIPVYEVGESSPFQSYLILIYKGCSALTNLGYETMRPDNPVEMGLCLGVMLIQIFLQAYILGTMFHHLVAADTSFEEYKSMGTMLQQFGKDRQLPVRLQLRMMAYLEFQYTKMSKHYGSRSINLPRTLLMRVVTCQFKKVVDTCTVRGAPLNECNPQFFTLILLNLREVYLMPGEVLMKHKDIARELGFVGAGAIEIVDGETDLVVRSVHGDNLDMPTILGEIPFFLNTVHPFKVVCRSDNEAKVLTISREDFDSFLPNYPEQQDIIVTNILANFGLDHRGKDLPTWKESAAGDGDERKLRDFVREAVVRHWSDMETQLLYAVSTSDVEQIKGVIRAGVDVNTSTYDQSSMLHMASINGNTNAMEVLLDEGADKNIVDRWGYTPLHWAIESGNQQAIDLLTRQGAVLSVTDPAGELCESASRNDIAQLQRLIENGARPDAGDYDKRTALHLAAASGAEKAVECLLSHGVDVNPKDRWGGIPLMDAIMGGHLMATLVLRNAGGKLTDKGTSASFLCEAASEGDVGKLKLLRDCNIDMNEGDYDSRGALHVAASEGKLPAVSYLLSVSAKPNERDRWGCTPLESALEERHFLCAKILQANGGVLGASPSKQVVENLKYMEANVTFEDAREVLGEMLDRDLDKKIVRRLREVDLLATKLTAVRSLEAGFALRNAIQEAASILKKQSDDFQQILEKNWIATKSFVSFWSALPAAQGVGKLQNAVQFSKLQVMFSVANPSHASEKEDKEDELHKAADLARRRSDADGDDFDGLHGDFDAEQHVTDDHQDLIPAGLPGTVNAPSSQSRGDLTQNAKADSAAPKSIPFKHMTEMATEGMPAAQAQVRIFNQMVVANLEPMQNTFDQLKEAFQKLAASNGNLMEARQISQLLNQLNCQPKDSATNQIMFEAAVWHSNKAHALERDNSNEAKSAARNIHGFEELANASLRTVRNSVAKKQIELSELWAACPTFWSLCMKDNSNHQNETSERKESHPLAHIRKDLVSVHTIMSTLFEAFCDEDFITSYTLHRVAASVGEYGQHAFKEMFFRKNNDGSYDQRHLTREECFLCFLNYLAGSGSEMPALRRIDGSTAASDDEAPTRSLKSSLSSFNEAKDRIRRLIKTPISNREMFEFFQNGESLSKTTLAFEKVTGSTTRALKSDGVLQFLKELFPTRLISEGHAKYFVAETDKNGNNKITFQELLVIAKKEAQKNGDDENNDNGPNSDIEKPLSMFDGLQGSFNVKYFANGVFIPNTNIMRFWDNVMRTLAVYNFIFVPIQIASTEVQNSFTITIVDWVVDGVFIADIFIQFFRGFYRDSVLVTDLKEIYQSYISGKFLFDATAAMPLSIIAINASPQVQAWLRLPKIIRIRALYLDIQAQQTKVQGFTMLKSLSRLLLLTVVVAHVLACTYIFIGRPSQQWMSRVVEVGDYGVSETSDVWDHYLVAFYYVMATMTTNGVVGELTPATYSEVVFCSILMVVNMTLFAYILGEISTLIMKNDDKLSEARKEQSIVENFINSKDGMTKELENDIRSYMSITRARGQSVDIGIIYQLMSHPLKVEIAEVICRDMLESVTLFFGCNMIFLDSLAVLLREATFDEGEVIFQMDELATHMYLVTSGKVERRLEINGDKPVLDGVSEAGDCMGELSFFFGMRHIYKAQTTSITETFTLERTAFMGLIKHYPDQENLIADNALLSYEAKMNGADAQSAVSGGTVNTLQSEVMEAIIGRGVKHTISLLKQRRHMAAAEKAIKTAASGDVARLKQSIRGLNVNSVNHDGRTCLHLAASNGHIQTVKYLVDDLGADISIVDKHDNSALNDAVRHEHDEVAAFLRGKGAKLKLHDSKAASALCEAAYANSMAELKRLIENGVDPGLADYDGRTALHLAASEGHKEIVAYLIVEGVSLNQKDRMGCTPLEDAIRHDHPDIQKMIRAAGGVMSSQAVALCEAAAKGDLDFIKKMILNGADINEGDYDGRTALHLAASEGKLSVMDFLLSYHKSPEFCHLQPLELNPVDRMGCTPLDDAIRHSQKIVELLLRETGAVDKDSEEMKRVRERHEELQKQRLRDTAAATAESNIRGKSEDRDCKMFQELVAKLNSMTSLNTLEKMEPKLEELKLLYAAGGFLKTTKKTKKSSQKNIAAIQECFRSICADIQAEWTSVTSKRLTGISKIPRGFLVGEGFDLELLIEGLNSKVERAVELLEFLTQIK